MKILFISAVLPYPLYSGGQVRIYNLLKKLSKKHDITLYAFVRKDEEFKYLTYLDFCKKVVPVLRGRAMQPKYLVGSVFGKYPWLYETYDNKSMRELVSQDIKNNSYDLVHIEPSYVFPSVPQNDLPLVVCDHNIESEVYGLYVSHVQPFFLRPFLTIDVLKMKRWEETVWKRASTLIAVSPHDKKHIQAKVSTPVITVENGVDEETFSFRPKKKLSSPLQFLFVGNFTWMQNRDSVDYTLKNIWPLLKKRFPDAEFHVIGRGMPDDQRERATQAGMTVREKVENIHEAYIKADMLIAPIRIGGGTKYKILEAMASGLPVITTPKGAEGLTKDEIDTISVASSPEELLKMVVMLTQDDVRTLQVKKARNVIEDKYTWDAIAKKLDTVWEKAKI